ncbi:MAG TPA: hypothetical protein VLA66_11200 [Thermoanaerobaculia bacterium]|nr:hypothetical protein [Thermoanaerobaculia bacterium]
MDLVTLQRFFLCSTIVSFGLYLVTVGALFTFRRLVVAIHRRLFGMDEPAVQLALHGYLTNFKLLAMILFLVPWLALEML